MKAAQINSYGDSNVIEININVVKPQIKPNQILVENYAASINAIDWKLRAGFLQKMVPLSFPITLGGDFSGKVVKVGEEVTAFKEGDEVYGYALILNGGSGSMAEYVTANSENTAHKPKSIDFIAAASLPLVGVSALQAIEDHISSRNESSAGRKKILIHGGAGGIGSHAIQVAKSKGLHVAVTAKSSDHAFVKSLGADIIIDYKSHKFEEMIQDFDAVFDTVGGETTDRSFKVLKRGGTIVSMLGQPNQEYAKKLGVTAIGLGTNTNTENLTRLARLVDEGVIKPQVDKVFSLEQAAEAFTYQEHIHPRGKVVLKIK